MLGGETWISTSKFPLPSGAKCGLPDSHSSDRGTYEKLLFFGLRNQSKARKLNAGESGIILEGKEAGKGTLTFVHNISD